MSTTTSTTPTTSNHDTSKYDIEHLWVKISSALDHIATSAPPTRDRVGNAWLHTLGALHRLDFPPPQRDVWDEVAVILAEGVASIDRLTDRDVDQLAREQELVQLYGWVVRQIPAELAEAHFAERAWTRRS